MTKTIEVHRVNWLRAKAAFDRASEETLLVKHEMQWTVNYFQYHSNQWKEKKLLGISYGHTAYAARQEAMWSRFASSAMRSFISAGVAIDCE